MAQVRSVNGVAVSPGLALGPVHVVRAKAGKVPTWSVGPHEVEREIERVRVATASASEELERRQRIVAEQASEADAQIFAVHRAILQDPGALAQVESMVQDERINAEAAVAALIRRLEQTLGKMEGDSVRSYAADLADPWRDVLEELVQGERREFLATDEKVILAAAELTPQVLIFLERDRLLGVVTETGGRFSHGAVLARAFGIPCVAGLPNLLSRLEQGMTVSVDGGRGIVQLRPEQSDIDDLLMRRSSMEARHQSLTEEAHLPAITPDGDRLQVMVNIESLRDLDMFQTTNTDGLGLVRTEFLYLERPEFPSEDEQFRLYRRVLERMAGLPVTLRTLDIGGDKRLPYFRTPEETNPALGWRGLRVSLEWQDLLRVQLRAALRAGAGHELRLMLPMVTSLEDIVSVHEIFDGVRESLASQGHEIETSVPVGMMIEVPSVLFCLPSFLEAIDFVSVGTNDLVQYLLAVDRDNPWVASLYQPYHPAVIAALSRVARMSSEASVPCSVCGDMAEDPATAVLLLGMGYDAVSVAPHFFPEIKYVVRKTSSSDARGFAERVLAQTNIADVLRVMSEFRERLHGI
jgi:phosphoenolpyruvate-protein phosphotransferase